MEQYSINTKGQIHDWRHEHAHRLTRIFEDCLRTHPRQNHGTVWCTTR
jgi:hypothetical protein